MTNKKTVLLVRNASMGDFGGAETYQVSLARVLLKNDYNPIIVSRSKKMLSYAAKQGIQTHKAWWWSRQNWSGKWTLLFPVYILWQLALTFWFIQLIVRKKAQAVHLQSKDDFIAGSIAGALLRRKVVWTDHMDLRYVFENISKPLRNPVGKLVFLAGHLANHIILISTNECHLVTGHFKKQSSLKRQIILVRNGVIDTYNQFDRKKETESFSFCLASRIVGNKGIGEAIEAFKLLNVELGASTNIRLDIFGDGEGLTRFKQQSQGLSSIVFHGHQVNAIDKVNSADVYVLPSYQEGFSIALLEATMLGKVIIASNVDSNPEIITDGETGLLVPPRDSRALKHAMKKVLMNPDLRDTLEINARNNYLANFNLEDIARKEIIPLYEN